MKTKSLIFVAFIIFLMSLVSCHDKSGIYTVKEVYIYGEEQTEIFTSFYTSIIDSSGNILTSKKLEHRYHDNTSHDSTSSDINKIVVYDLDGRRNVKFVYIINEQEAFIFCIINGKIQKNHLNKEEFKKIPKNTMKELTLGINVVH